MKVLNLKSTISIIITIFLFCSCLVFFASGEIKAESDLAGKIVYVDLWAIFSAHPDKPAAEAELNQLAQSMQAELEEKAEGLPNDQKQELLREYQSRLTEREQDIVQGIVDSIKEIIIQIAEDKEVRMVLDKSNVLYGGYDMTGDVIVFIEQSITEDEIENKDIVTEGLGIDEELYIDKDIIIEIE